jgi:hypothetical protein
LPTVIAFEEPAFVHFRAEFMLRTTAAIKASNTIVIGEINEIAESTEYKRG